MSKEKVAEYLVSDFKRIVYGREDYAGPYDSFTDSDVITALDFLSDKLLESTPTADDIERFIRFWNDDFRKAKELVPLFKQTWEQPPLLFRFLVKYKRWERNEKWLKEYDALDEASKIQIEKVLMYVFELDSDFSVFFQYHDSSQPLLFEVANGIQKELLNVMLTEVTAALIHLTISGGVLTIKHRDKSREHDIVSGVASFNGEFSIIAGSNMSQIVSDVAVKTMGLQGASYRTPSIFF